VVLYAILTVVISLIPVLMGELRWFYLIAAVLLGGVLLVRSVRLYQTLSPSWTLSLYKYSMLYLALLFVAMAIDRAMWM
jgi:protoheme IX farnesyltransferase